MPGWIIMTEPYSQRLRLLQSTITMVVYWTSTWLVGFITPYMVDATAGDLGVRVCYIWLVMIILSLVWAFFYVPELAGLSMAEVFHVLPLVDPLSHMRLSLTFNAILDGSSL